MVELELFHVLGGHQFDFALKQNPVGLDSRQLQILEMSADEQPTAFFIDSSGEILELFVFLSLNSEQCGYLDSLRMRNVEWGVDGGADFLIEVAAHYGPSVGVGKQQRKSLDDH